VVVVPGLPKALRVTRAAGIHGDLGNQKVCAASFSVCIKGDELLL